MQSTLIKLQYDASAKGLKLELEQGKEGAKVVEQPPYTFTHVETREIFDRLSGMFYSFETQEQMPAGLLMAVLELIKKKVEEDRKSR